MTKQRYETFLSYLRPDNRYKVEERTAIKIDSGIPEAEAMQQSVNEFKKEMERAENDKCKV